MSKELRDYLKERLGVPDNWDKFDYRTQRYSFEDIEEILESKPQESKVNRSELFDLLEWMQKEPAFNIDNINEILDDYAFYKQKVVVPKGTYCDCYIKYPRGEGDCYRCGLPKKP
jgi:hypothetical protein